jgi:siroheme synthase
MALAWNATGKIFVGERHGRETVAQSEIERMLVCYARGGNKVVRLESGDLSLRGRGSEEAQAFAVAESVNRYFARKRGLE